MADTVEKINGTWTDGKPYSIKKIWGKSPRWEGHEFSAEEAAKLFAGETIEFDAISKAGKQYKAKGLLAMQSFTDDEGNTHEYLGFTLKFDDQKESTDDVERFTGMWDGKEVKVKRVWGEHRFTDEEVAHLLAGDTIKFQAKSQRTGNYYTAEGKLAEQEYSGNKFIGFKPNFG